MQKINLPSINKKQTKKKRNTLPNKSTGYKFCFQPATYLFFFLVSIKKWLMWPPWVSCWTNERFLF